MKYLIPATKIEEVKKSIERLNKRAQKLNCEPLVFEVGQSIVEKRQCEVTKINYDLTSYECICTGISPKLNGWHLVAILEPIGANNEILVKEIPGQECPAQYRLSDLCCDHCHTIRRRNKVYVLVHEDGTYKQVGSNCLADFLGHASLDTNLLFSLTESCMNFQKDLGNIEHFGNNTEPCCSVHYFVAIANCIIRKLGWTSRNQLTEGDAIPTANLAFEICTSKNKEEVCFLIKKYGLEPNHIDEAFAKEAINWAVSIDASSAHNTYLHDLAVCCRSNFVISKTAGYVASLVVTYQRYLSNQNNTNKATATHVGTVGLRETFSDLRIVKVQPINSGIYLKTLVRFIDPNGNILIWWASGSPDWVVVGTTLTIRATVEKHDSYKQIPQTEIKRVKVLTSHHLKV